MIAIIILSVALAASAILARYWARAAAEAESMLAPWKMRALSDESRIEFLSKAWARERDRVKELEALVYERDASIALLNGRLERADEHVGSTAAKLHFKRDALWSAPDLRTPEQHEFDQKVAVAKLAMDCACCHPADCDCRTTYLQFRDLAQEQA